MLTAGQPDDEPAPGMSPELVAREAKIWQEMQAELPKLSTNSAHVVAARSHHVIQREAPALVIAAVREVVEAARAHGRVDGARLAPLAR